jgi:hypothetical protein
MRLVFSLAAVLSAAACQTLAVGGERPARIEPQRMDDVRQVLERELGRASLEFGPAEEGRVTVLPPRLGPYEDRSPVMPTVFRVLLRGETCFLVEENGESEVELPDGTCVDQRS